MTSAEDTRVTVTQITRLGGGRGLRGAEVSQLLVQQPPVASLALLPLQLGLG